MTNRSILLLILIISSVALLAFLYRTPNEAPIDDAYIGYQYAKNIAENKGIVFNENQNKGVGITTIFWVLILSSGIKIGINEILFSKILGVVSYFISIICIFYLSKIISEILLEKNKRKLFCFISTLFYSLSGNILWFTVSGMETIVFISMSLISLIFYLKKKQLLLGLVVGLSTLIRLEGFLLLLSIILIDIIRRESKNKILLYILSFLFVLIPWIIFMYANTGDVFPTTFSGKKYTQITAINRISQNLQQFSSIAQIKPLLFFSEWFFYSFYFVFGGYYLPGSKLPLNKIIEVKYFDPSLLGVIIFIFGVLPLAFLGIREIVRNIISLKIKHLNSSVILIFVFWIVLHNLSYVIFLPTLGTTSRYQGINHYIIWSIPLLGVLSLNNKRYMMTLLFLLIFLSIFNVIFWSNVYRTNMTHIEKVRKETANFVENISSDRIAAHDIGVIKYYSSKTIVDLGGLTDKDFIGYKKINKVDEYLKLNNVSYLVLPGKHSTEYKPIYDFLEFLNLTNSTNYSIEEIKSFEIDFETWELGFAPTWNYLPSVKIFRINWLN